MSLDQKELDEIREQNERFMFAHEADLMWVPGVNNTGSNIVLYLSLAMLGMVLLWAYFIG